MNSCIGVIALFEETRIIIEGLNGVLTVASCLRLSQSWAGLGKSWNEGGMLHNFTVTLFLFRDRLNENKRLIRPF